MSLFNLSEKPGPAEEQFRKECDVSKYQLLFEWPNNMCFTPSVCSNPTDTVFNTSGLDSHMHCFQLVLHFTCQVQHVFPHSEIKICGITEKSVINLAHEMLYISLQRIIVCVYNIWWRHMVEVISIFQTQQCYPYFNTLVEVDVSLSAWSTAGTVTEIASYHHQNIHKLRHNGQNTAWILKLGGRGQAREERVHFSIHSSPSLTYSMALKSL